MPRTRPPYPAEFRAQIVALHQAGRTPEDLAKEFEPSAATIRTWIAQAAVDERAAAAAPRAERTGALTTAEREELARLRREVKQLKVERDILGNAAVDSTGECNTPSRPLYRGAPWRRSVVRACRRTSGSRSGRCGRPATPSR